MDTVWKKHRCLSFMFKFYFGEESLQIVEMLWVVLNNWVFFFLEFVFIFTYFGRKMWLFFYCDTNLTISAKFHVKMMITSEAQTGFCSQYTIKLYYYLFCVIVHLWNMFARSLKPKFTSFDLLTFVSAVTLSVETASRQRDLQKKQHLGVWSGRSRPQGEHTWKYATPEDARCSII